MPGDNDNIRAYVRAKHGVEEVRKETAKRKRDASAAVKQLRAELDGHIHSNVKYLVAGATEDGSTTLVAFRKVCVSSKRVTADAVREAWGAVYLEALRAPEGAEGTAAALNLLEEELQRRLAVCRETVEVVPQGTKQDPPEMESVHVDAVPPEVKDLVARLWLAKREAKELAAEESSRAKAFRDEVRRLEPAVKEALGDIPGASSRVDESARPVYVRRKTQWKRPKIDFRAEIAPVVEGALSAAAAGGPAAARLEGVEVIDRLESVCCVTLDEAS